MRVLVTRAIEDAERTALKLQARGHVPVLAPLRRCEPLAGTVAPGDYVAMLATSRHAFAGEPLPAWLSVLPCYCVGQRTAEAARHAGFHHAEALGGDGAALAGALAPRLPPGARLVYLAGSPRHSALEEGLAARGFHVTVHSRYAMVRAARLPDEAGDALRAGTLDAALHYSAESARAFLTLVDAAHLLPQAQKIPHLCLSAAIAAVFPPGFRLFTAKIAEEDALLALLEST